MFFDTWRFVCPECGSDYEFQFASDDRHRAAQYAGLDHNLRTFSSCRGEWSITLVARDQQSLCPPGELLPVGAPNPMVWCERCQRYHRYWTLTQADHDRIIAEAAKKLADAIDAQALASYQKPTSDEIGSS